MDTATEGVVLWVVVLGALLVVGLIVTRRMNTLATRTRTLDGFQLAATSIARRLAEATGPLVSQLDEIRRRSGDPPAVAAALPALQEELRGLVEEGRALRAPTPLVGPTAAFVVELERAVRATDMLEHGLDALLAHRGGRDLEAQTSLKRGALNLRHATEAATRIAREIAILRPPDLVASTAGRAAAPPGATGSAPTYLVDMDMDDDRR